MKTSLFSFSSPLPRGGRQLLAAGLLAALPLLGLSSCSEQEAVEPKAPLQAATAQANVVPSDAEKLQFYLQDYYALNQDLQGRYSSADNRGLVTHWETYGIPEGRAGSVLYSGTYYLENNPDLEAQFGTGPDGYRQAAQHWVNYGVNEGRRASPYFDPRAYLANHADLQAAYGPTGYGEATLHYYRYGRREGRNPL